MRAGIVADLLAGYARRRAAAQEAARERREEAVRAAPLYADLGVALARVMAGSAREGGDAGQRVRALREEAEAQLRRAGFAPEDLGPRYDCPLCGDTGYVGGIERRFCPCFEKRLREEVVRRSGLSSRPGHTFAQFDLSVFPQEEGRVSQRATMGRLLSFARDWAERFPENPRRDIVLSGATGLGKTFLADCIAAEVIARGYTALRLTAFRLMEAMRLRHFGRDEEGLMEVMLEVDLLLIDDLGTEPLLENITVEYLFTLLNERRQEGRSTLVATNLSPGELRARYTERITSRLLDTGSGALFLLSGRDVRLRREEKG